MDLKKELDKLCIFSDFEKEWILDQVEGDEDD